MIFTDHGARDGQKLESAKVVERSMAFLCVHCDGQLLLQKFNSEAITRPLMPILAASPPLLFCIVCSALYQYLCNN